MNKQLVKIIVCLGMVLVSAAPATIVNAADEEAEGLQEIADDYNQNKDSERSKVVCTMEAQVGSRFKTKVCRSVGTMERQNKEGKQLLDRSRTSVGKQE
ncbi:MAG TPA: hypothetical protein VJN91_00545 [Gammaproteobacteria bacterium]|nr:hypothetical protein [Gammaproteobacteria bacterium]